MNRPKKNNVTNPTLPDDQQVIDERNLIDLEDTNDLSVEDRIQMYWMENKSFISGCVACVALVIIAVNGMKIYKEHAEANIQAAYAEAQASSTLADFAKEYSNKDLGGFAALTVADEAYSSEDYALAAEYYALASDSIESDLLAARAKLGLAFATYKNGDTTGGKSQLDALIKDESLPAAIRAEAAYHLAIDADVNGEATAYENYTTQLAEIGAGSQWQQRLQLYQQQR